MEKTLILLVEDNPDDEFLALRALRRQGMENVVVARDGEEALAYLFGPGCPNHEGVPLEPCLIILDLKLPKRNGLEVLQALRGNERTGRIPVIIISSSREESELSRCRDLGVLGYLTKPVDGVGIVEILQKARIMEDSPP